MNRIRGFVLMVVLLGSGPAATEAQQRRTDFARMHRIEPVDTPTTFPEITLELPEGTFAGLLLGGTAGLVAALPVFVESAQTCAECMVSPAIVFPIWAAGGMLLGGVTGAAATAAYYPRSLGGKRSYSQDMMSGATIGLALGLVAVVAATTVRSDDWSDGPSDDGFGESFKIGLAAPLFTLVGAITGAIVDGSGGDVPCPCAWPGRRP